MKKPLFFAAILAAFATVISCNKETDPSTEGTSAVTGEASHISCRNAEISGKANISGSMSIDLFFGMLYSTSSGILIGTAKQIEAKTYDSKYNFTVSTEVLEPETTYYYRSYIIQNSEVSYGGVVECEMQDGDDLRQIDGHIRRLVHEVRDTVLQHYGKHSRGVEIKRRHDIDYLEC